MKEKARRLRREQTDTEKLLWQNLRDRQIADCKFRRQHNIGSYIVDFVCLEKKIIIEIDGGQHAENIKYDMKRTRFLNKKGFKVIRFWNNEVMGNLAVVLEQIFREIT